MQQGDKRMDMPPDMKLEMEKAQFRDPNFIVLNALQPGAKLRGLPQTTDGGVTYDTLEVISPEGDVYKLLLDRQDASGRQDAATSRSRSRRTTSSATTASSTACRSRSSSSTTTGGQQVDIQYDKVTVNPKLANDLFQ